MNLGALKPPGNWEHQGEDYDNQRDSNPGYCSLQLQSHQFTNFLSHEMIKCPHCLSLWDTGESILSKTLTNIFLIELNVRIPYHLSPFKRKTRTSQCTSFRNSPLRLRIYASSPGRREHRVWPQKTITLSCEFLIWPKICYPRPSHNLLMTSSTFKCQVLIFSTLPLRGIISLMRNTDRHLHPRSCDASEALSPPTWNLPHIKHAEVK